MRFRCYVKILPGEFWFGTTFLCSKSTVAGMQALNSSVLIANNNISKSNLARFDLAHAIFDLAGGILIIQKALKRSESQASKNPTWLMISVGFNYESYLLTT